MAGSMRTSTETILNLPQYTFGMYQRSTGFVPIRAHPAPLSIFDWRDDAGEMQAVTEKRYGPSKAPKDGNGSDRPGRSGNGKGMNGQRRPTPPPPPKPPENPPDLSDVDPI
jgi:hypothetical protein